MSEKTMKLRVVASHPTGATFVRVLGVPTLLGREWMEVGVGDVPAEDFEKPWIEVDPQISQMAADNSEEKSEGKSLDAKAQRAQRDAKKSESEDLGKSESEKPKSKGEDQGKSKSTSTSLGKSKSVKGKGVKAKSKGGRG
ncbi:hypothetical protein CVU37_15090 [candidate division BRC1 bacterium HGW-BRC1-1]|jgi:hypothetical protein|nr:MAG: hypothetical protein CVU37_15090 [candidate division BRC1 bacterium HGW-BRC1-1]